MNYFPISAEGTKHGRGTHYEVATALRKKFGPPAPPVPAGGLRRCHQAPPATGLNPWITGSTIMSSALIGITANFVLLFCFVLYYGVFFGRPPDEKARPLTAEQLAQHPLLLPSTVTGLTVTREIPSYAPDEQCPVRSRYLRRVALFTTEGSADEIVAFYQRALTQQDWMPCFVTNQPPRCTSLRRYTRNTIARGRIVLLTGLKQSVSPSINTIMARIGWKCGRYCPHHWNGPSNNQSQQPHRNYSQWYES